MSFSSVIPNGHGVDCLLVFQSRERWTLKNAEYQWNYEKYLNRCLINLMNIQDAQRTY